MWKSEKVWKSMRKHVKIWESMWKYKKEWEIFKRYNNVWEIQLAAAAARLLKSLLYEKAACIILVKLITGVNFINVLREHFLYECLFGSFSLVTFSLWKNYKSTLVQKNEHVKCWWNLPQVAAAKYMSVGVGSLTARIGCESKLPNVYTRVDYYLKWIEKETGIMIKP
jgi:hypothetical protein